MRQDTRVLLDRLGEETFRYYDFESPSAETDVWPMFEALLLDERVVGRITRHGMLDLSPPTTQIVPAAVTTERAGPDPAFAKPVVAAKPQGMFGNYGAVSAIDGAVSAIDDVGESVRDQLHRLVTPRR